MAKRLVLWDIDHTLIATRGVGREIMAVAFERATGRPMERAASVTGKSELVILRETLALHGIDPATVDFGVYADALAEGYLRRAGDLRERGHALPGAAAVLDALDGVPEVRQTAATGNLRRVAETKLQVFGLDRYIDWDAGGYGEDAEDRADMVRAALRRGGGNAADTVLLGDTPADVAAGLECGVFTIGVATGKTSVAELEAAGAAVVLADLHEVGQVVEIVRHGRG